MGDRVRPDWVIMGWEKDGTYYVMASDQLASGDIIHEHEVRRDRDSMYDSLFQTRGHYEFTARTVNDTQDGKPQAVKAQGDSYAAALRRLFEAWRPAEHDRPILLPQMQQLPKKD